jgi:hypothetical protein
MQRIYIKAFNALKKMGVPVYEHGDDNGNFSISAEASGADQWASYYDGYLIWNGESTNPALDSTLRQFGLYAEWVNPGRLAVYPA